MSQSLGAVLFQSATRSAVLQLLFLDGLEASASELARRAGLSPRAIGKEIRHLLPTGLILVEAVGGADVVRANLEHPGARPLRSLLRLPGEAPREASTGREAREALVWWGAPLAGVPRVRRFELTETILRGLEEARHDGTVLRVLPVVLARNLDGIDWAQLREAARRRKLKAELGLLVELTAELLGRPSLKLPVAALMDRRRRTMRFFPEVKNRFETELARQRSPAVAQRWGFWMNVSEGSFRATLEKHRA